jgi:formylglycine-generating enzyme required for sulfatase activity
MENQPITCVSWYEAYAFCIWDGGFLPSEAEWGYAAAGGSQQREFPWGTADPGTMNQYALYGCYYPTAGACTGSLNIAPVGTAPRGAGLWGQVDLAGNVWEWTLDGYVPYVDPCTDCAFLATATLRVARGGGFSSDASGLLPADRSSGTPAERFSGFGFRCARSP